MEESKKQRLVGAGVLVALAVIFLPALFDKDERVAIDITTQIPPSPEIQAVNIPLPSKPEGIKVPPSSDRLFQPIVDENSEIKDENEVGLKESTKAVSSAASKAPRPIEKTKALSSPEEKAEVAKQFSKPSLNNQGVPQGWVIQAASFKSSDSAKAFTDKLSAAGYKSYSQSVKTPKGLFYRVLIGPYIDESKANDAKLTIDKVYKLNSKVLRFNPISEN